MASLLTSLLSVAKIEVKAVRFARYISVDGVRVFATQDVTIRMNDSTTVVLTLHLDEGCNVLAAGEAVVLPSLDEVAE
ncbi:hypothetical protein [Ralstonia solanacearum]|uniref:hypothetical protein n=1 Tax=Ralstonia solanacearum TaxID=305 RepID=UPI0006DC1A6C|nr:hypothetical protein [Ralstonia solanacearum]MCL9847136.1 hypothetical protein [Ralstonia solanacearum]MDC6260229.1 hypothetical protein [Ralstonia solanacearum]MDC6305161.1 hypothetical protein [Ralstonia solanacearum]